MLKIRAYHSPTTLDEAVTLLAEDGRTVIAGGTDLLVNPRYTRRYRHSLMEFWRVVLLSAARQIFVIWRH